MNIWANHTFQDKGTNSWGRGDHTPFIRFVQFTRKLLSGLCWFIMNDPAWQITSGHPLAALAQRTSCMQEHPWANRYVRKHNCRYIRTALITDIPIRLKIWWNCASGPQKTGHSRTVHAIAVQNSDVKNQIPLEGVKKPRKDHRDADSMQGPTARTF